jgi:threonine synthase
MDILISSNLERLIFELSGRDTALTEKRMEELKNNGVYKVSKDEKLTLDKEFFAGYTDEEECKETIAEVFDEYGYVLDPHTSVAYDVAMDFIDYENNDNPVVILSTASPYKFAHDVLSAIKGKAPVDAFKASEILSQETAAPIPNNILSLKEKERRFTKVIDRNDTVDAVMEFISK